MTIDIPFFSQYKAKIETSYRNVTKRYLDLNNPITFNEKLQFLKCYDSTPEKTFLADKFLVRDYIKQKIGDSYLIPLLGVYNNFDEIDFSSLPNKFVMKCNHASGFNMIVQDKNTLDIELCKNKFSKWLSIDYSTSYGYELHYRDIPRKIVIEKYIDTFGELLYNYRFLCSYGKILQIWVDYHFPEGYKRDCYDENFNLLDIAVGRPRMYATLDKPISLDLMKDIAKKLSTTFSFVRVDLYNVQNKIYFAELTFTSLSGYGSFHPDICDYKLGQQIKLPDKLYDFDNKKFFGYKFKHDHMNFYNLFCHILSNACEHQDFYLLSQYKHCLIKKYIFKVLNYIFCKKIKYFSNQSDLYEYIIYKIYNIIFSKNIKK